MIRKFFRYCFRGLIIALPFAVLFAFLREFVAFINSTFLHTHFLVATIASVFLLFPIGLVFSGRFVRRFFRGIGRHTLIHPHLHRIYCAGAAIVKKISLEERIFEHPVWIVDEGTDTRVMGFLTQESLESFDLPDHVCVFRPDSFSLHGEMLVVPKKSVISIEKNKEQAFALAMSGGLLLPHEINQKMLKKNQ